MPAISLQKKTMESDIETKMTANSMDEQLTSQQTTIGPRDVLINAALSRAWVEMGICAIEVLAALGHQPVVHEYARLDKDGSITFYIPFPNNTGQISMNIAPGHWEWRARH
jgi:hypothetical protein